MDTKYVAYYRVSTTKQGLDGLGMEAQKRAVTHYLSVNPSVLLSEFSEVESGKRKDRPELHKAISLCIKDKATLLIARLDRLARNLHFITTLQQAKISFVAVDNPHATPFLIHILCAVAEQEALSISIRTKTGWNLVRDVVLNLATLTHKTLSDSRQSPIKRERGYMLRVLHLLLKS